LVCALALTVAALSRIKRCLNFIVFYVWVDDHQKAKYQPLTINFDEDNVNLNSVY